MCDKLSEKMRAMSFLAMACVVLIHSDSTLPVSGLPQWFSSLANFIHLQITCWAVPFFFLASGYWFAKGHYATNRMAYKDFVVVKFRSLIVPYLVGVVISTIVAVPVICFANQVAHRALLAGTFLEPLNWMLRIDQLLGMFSHQPLHHIALWYVRALIILFAFGFVWKSLLRVPSIGVGIFAVIGLSCLINLVPSLWLFNTSNRVGYFFFGIMLTRFEFKQGLPKMIAIPLLLIAIACSVMSALAHVGFVRYLVSPTEREIVTCIWIVAIWSLLPNLGILSPYLHYSFWVYLIHIPLVTVLLPLGRFVLGRSVVGLACASALTFCATLFLSLTLAYACQRRAPSLYTILSGGR